MANYTKPIRIDPKFLEDMKLTAKIRLDRGLAKLNMRELSLAEMTRLATRTDSYPNLLEELRTKPKRRQQR